MTPEIWTMIGVGVAIAALTLTQSRRSNRLILDRIENIETRMYDHFQSIETQIAELRERMTHLDGSLEGLRVAISRHRAT